MALSYRKQPYIEMLALLDKSANSFRVKKDPRRETT